MKQRVFVQRIDMGTNTRPLHPTVRDPTDFGIQICLLGLRPVVKGMNHEA